MNIITIILFFVYCYGIGFSLDFFVKSIYENKYEKHIMRFGIGLSILSILGVILSSLRIPIDWKVILVISLIIPVFYFFKNYKSVLNGFYHVTFGKGIKKSEIFIIIVLLMFAISLFVSLKGAFLYPHFEDDDPWTYAVGVKYIAEQKSLVEPFEGKELYQYIDPYPPGYSFVLAILYQTSGSLMWTLKFFNSIFVALSILFFYFFAKEFMNNKKRALISTFLLLMVPCFLTHFIWSHSLILIVFFVSLYCLERCGKEKLWLIPALLSVASIFVIQPTQAIKLSGLIIIYLVVKSFYTRKLVINQTKAFVCALVLSLFWWFNKIGGMLKAGGGRRLEEAISQGAVSTGFFQSLFLRLKTAFPYDGGTATRAYVFKDYFFAQSQGLINNQPGLGMLIFILLVLGLVYVLVLYKSVLKKNQWITISLGWFIFTFLGMNSMTFHLPFGLIAWRFWMLFAIPVVLLSSLGFSLILGFGKSKFLKLGIVLILIILVFMTAGIQKYRLNTSSWPGGAAWSSQDEFEGYLWLKSLPIGTKVFDYSSIPEFVTGYDKNMCSYCETTLNLRYNILDFDANQLYGLLKKEKYDYLIIGQMSTRYHTVFSGQNKTLELLPERINQIQNSEHFNIAYSNKGVTVFKIL